MRGVRVVDARSNSARSACDLDRAAYDFERAALKSGRDVYQLTHDALKSAGCVSNSIRDAVDHERGTTA